MEKLYTKEEYALLAEQASNTGNTLYKVQKFVDCDVEVYEYEQKTIEIPVFDNDGELTDKTKPENVDDLTKPIIVDGEHQHHTETKQKFAETLDVKPAGYYICSEGNITDGTLNPDFEQEQAEKEKQNRIAQIKRELDTIDLKSVRPLRAGETDRLATLEAQAAELREELAELL